MPVSLSFVRGQVDDNITDIGPGIARFYQAIADSGQQGVAVKSVNGGFHI